MRLRSAFLLASTLAGLVVLNSHGSAAGQSTGPAVAIPRLEHTTFTLSNGLEGHLLPGQAAADGGRQPLVSRRPRQRDPGTHRLRAPLRAHDVPGLEARRRRHALQAARGRRRLRHQRHHQLRSHQLLRDRAVEPARARALDRVRSHGLPPRRARREGLANQRDVVRNERRQSVENQPYGIADEALYQALYPPGHPYHGVVIGSHADLAAAQLGDVQQFFRQYYTPNNASLAIVGDFDPAAARKLVEKYFGSLKRGPDVPKITATTPPITAGEAPHRHRHRQAAARLHRVAHAGDLQAGRCRRRSGRRDSRRRQIEPALQGAGLRQADRAGGHRQPRSR